MIYGLFKSKDLKKQTNSVYTEVLAKGLSEATGIY